MSNNKVLSNGELLNVYCLTLRRTNTNKIWNGNEKCVKETTTRLIFNTARKIKKTVSESSFTNILDQMLTCEMKNRKKDKPDLYREKQHRH